MQITNKFGLPETIVSALRRDKKYERQPNRISVTSLIAAQRPYFLEQDNWDYMQSDISDHVFALIGKGVHAILDKPIEGHLTEVKLTREMDGIVVSGVPDLIRLEGGGEASIFDYKVSTFWGFQQEKFEWEAQLNLYAWLVLGSPELAINNITALNIVAITRDWSKYLADKELEGPQGPMTVITVPLWDEKKTHDYIIKRLTAYHEAQTAHELGSPLPECSEEERWYRPGKLALMQDGMSRAVKLFDDTDKGLEEARRYAKKTSTPPTSFGKTSLHTRLVRRSGKSAKCLSYCRVSLWCKQWEAQKKREIDETVEEFEGD